MAAQEAAPSLEVELAAISPVVSPKAPLDYRVAVRNRSQGPVRDLEVSAGLGEPVDTRSELATLLATPGGAPVSQPLEQFRPAAAEVGGASTRLLERRRVALPPGLGDGQAGVVLPLTVRVRGTGAAGQVAASLTTFVVDLPVAASQPLRAALLVPVREPTHRNPAGDFVDDELAGLLSPTGSLGAIADELARPGAPTATMVVDGMLVEDATAMVGGWRLREKGKRTTVPPGDPRSGHADRFLQSLKKAAASHQPAAFAYGNADLPALVRVGGGRPGPGSRAGRARPDRERPRDAPGRVAGLAGRRRDRRGRAADPGADRRRGGGARRPPPPGAGDHRHPERHRRPGRRAGPAAGPGRRRRAVGGAGRPAGGQRPGRVGPAHPGRDRGGLAGTPQLERPAGHPARPAPGLAAHPGLLPVAGPAAWGTPPGCGSSRPPPWPPTSPRGRRRASAGWPR